MSKLFITTLLMAILVIGLVIFTCFKVPESPKAGSVLANKNAQMSEILKDMNHN